MCGVKRNSTFRPGEMQIVGDPLASEGRKITVSPDSAEKGKIGWINVLLKELS
jgi:hypothetical protein